MSSHSALRLAAAAAVFALGATCAHAAAAAPTAPAREPGDLWEVTSEMSMEGMPMAIPGQKQRVCAAKEWKEPPGAKNEAQKCTTVDFRTSATKTSWKVRCEGPPAMTGEGEINRSGADAYTGFMKLTSPEGVMTVKLNGRRVGDCDAAETKRQTAQMQAQIEKSQAEAAAGLATVCRQSVVDAMDLTMLTMPETSCTDPALKVDFCARLLTEQGFEQVGACQAEPRERLGKSAAFCGKDHAELRTGLCTNALQKESLDFLAKCCPVEAQGIAAAQCAGRKYTELAGSKYQGFCATFARNEMGGTESDPAAAAQEKPESGTSKAKKALKGLFKR